ncbi:Flp pilus assembly protein CpaB [Nesterenkonia massiliensis]|uniref:Flp pilus assembly protein CpaB n=1 Tax=Nesterenkonia massiliensis TaxID=1232429 RepID=A0ABT2HSC2_9MICC|nr:Flp pilus assembly protein CpaB [Nesterenkonia massiliensis]MCT1607593.1 Flp pilus assembly protein CpaB [Nesterenkonia massiliensis]
MNPKQLRGLVTLIIAGVGAVAVFLAVTSYVSEVQAEVGPTTEVYVATEEIGIYQPIGFEAVETQEVPNKYLNDQMITSQEQLAGMKATSTIREGSYLQEDMIEPSSSLGDGEREISINFTGDQGIHGRVQPGDRVDVIASFARDQGGPGAGDISYRRAQIPYNVSGVLVQNALVVSVGQPVDAGAAAGAAAEGGADPGMVVPVTFAVSVGQATQLAYGESFAVSMRIIRSGNNETGTAFDVEDQSFQDPDLGPNFRSELENEDGEEDSEGDED